MQAAKVNRNSFCNIVFVMRRANARLFSCVRDHRFPLRGGLAPVNTRPVATPSGISPTLNGIGNR